VLDLGPIDGNGAIVDGWLERITTVSVIMVMIMFKFVLPIKSVRALWEIRGQR